MSARPPKFIKELAKARIPGSENWFVIELYHRDEHQYGYINRVKEHRLSIFHEGGQWKFDLGDEGAHCRARAQELCDLFGIKEALAWVDVEHGLECPELNEA